MIQVAKAPDGTYSYVARDLKGEIILLGDECETIDVIRDFFSDLVACATDKKPSRLDVHIETVDVIDDPSIPKRMTIEGIGGLPAQTPEVEFKAGENQTVAKKVKSAKGKKKNEA